jgi:hypothetical protein
MSSNAQWLLGVLAALFAVKIAYHVAVGVSYFRAGIRGARIHISPVLFPDPFLILGITWLSTGMTDPRWPWPVMLLALAAVTVVSYLSWPVLYRAGAALGSRGRRPNGVSSG